MKRWLATLLLVAALASGLTGCAHSQGPSRTTQITAVAVTAAVVVILLSGAVFDCRDEDGNLC